MHFRHFGLDGTSHLHTTALARAKIGLFFDTQGGDTEEIAEKISKLINVEKINIEKVPDATDLTSYDGLIVGVPTHETKADEYRSGTGWDDIIDDIKELDFEGTPVAVFGLGDACSCEDCFCDALEELHRIFKSANANMIGDVSAEDYKIHVYSKSVVDGKFLGLALDIESEEDKTDERLSDWLVQLRKEGMPLSD